jgi:DNA polymerase III subunit delta'
VSWSGIAGQPLAVRLLSQASAGGRVSHAYLFSGPDGTGKRTVALELAKRLLCARPSEDGACDACPACRKASAWFHPDILLVEPDGRSIRIEQTRDLQRQLYIRPAEGSWRVGIVDGADRMGHEAANSILKLLEEPPGYAVLTLLTANLAGVLPTIISRCQVINFQPLAPDTIEQRLREQGVETATAAVAAALSGGSLGKALEMASGEQVGQVREETRQLLAGLDRLDDHTALATAEELDKRREELPRWLDLLLLWLRDLVITAEGGSPALLVNGDAERFLGDAARRYGRLALREMLAAVMAAQEQLQRNANTRLVLDVMLLRMVSRANPEAGIRS